MLYCPYDLELAEAAEQPVRMWIDRAFSSKAPGMVKSHGTWAVGRVKVGDRLRILTETGTHEVTVRGLHSENSAVEEAAPVMRLAVNLRGIDADSISRGDVLTAADSTWWRPEILTFAAAPGHRLDNVPKELNLHVGTASVPVHVRPLGAEHARLIVQGATLPLAHG